MECHVAARALGSEVPDHHDPAGMRIRQRFEQDRVHRAENRRRSADAKRQREDRDRREAWRAQHVASAVAKIAKKAFNGRPPPDRAAVLFHQSYIPKFAPSSGGSFFSGHATGNEFLDLLLEMLLNLFGKIVVQAAT